MGHPGTWENDEERFRFTPEVNGAQKRQSIEHGINEWGQVSGATITIIQQSDYFTDFSFVDNWTCAGVHLDTIHWEDLDELGNGLVAAGNACDTDDDGYIDQAIMGLDSDRNWNLDDSQDPGNN
jgi:hypothetical protein